MSNSTPLHYHDMYFQSFTVVDVVKARNELPDPADILCANSAPIALFSRRRKGQPWPRFSLHSLTDPSLPRDPNVTFTMRSIEVSATGRIPNNSIAFVWFNMIKLPPDDSLQHGKQPPVFPGLFRDAPWYMAGRFYQILVYFGPGPHTTFHIDWEILRSFLPGFGTKIDTFEIYGQLLKRNGPNEPYLEAGDWEVCVDDVDVQVVRKVPQPGEGESTGTASGRLFMFPGSDEDLILSQEDGEKLMEEWQIPRSTWN
jgi:hypothetical protein